MWLLQLPKLTTSSTLGYVDGGSGLDGYQGPFRYTKGSDKGMRITAVTDGTSNTIGFAESAGGLLSPDHGWFGFAYGHAHTISKFWSCPNADNGNCDSSAAGRGLGWGIPGSTHAGGRYNVCFVDGSVRSMNGGLDFQTYASICGAADGQVVNFD